MPTPLTRFDIPIEKWQACKQEVTHILRERVEMQKFIYYSDLVNRIQTIRFSGAIDERLYQLLGDISEDTFEQDNTMLSVMVVTKEDERPGQGFYTLARWLGRRGEDDEIFSEETKKLGL